MFNEINAQLLKDNQLPGQAEKHWYRDAERECDLFVWLDQAQRLERFQFWFKEELLEWDRRRGLKTGRLDNERGSFSSIQTPTFSYHLNAQKNILPIIYSLIKEETQRRGNDRLFRAILDALDGMLRKKILDTRTGRV